MSERTESFTCHDCDETFTVIWRGTEGIDFCPVCGSDLDANWEDEDDDIIDWDEE